MDIKNEIDKENLLETIKKIPDQLLEGPELVRSTVPKGDLNTFVISGMGGSALVGDLLNTYLAATKIPKNKLRIIVNRTYQLPEESFDNGSLNIISSYSGNTEEALANFEEALKNDLNCLGMASGGKLLDICNEKNIPYLLLPKPHPQFQPRMAYGYAFSALLKYFSVLGLVNDPLNKLKDASEKIKADLSVFGALGEDIAKKVKGKTPIIYASDQYRFLAMIWKIMFNENAKTPAFWNHLPELNHNEMVGFTLPQANFHFILLRDRNDYSQNLRRFEKTAAILKEYNFDSTIIDIPEGEIIYQVFSSLQIGCFASYHLALLYGIDPLPVAMVERFKKILAD
jgi:glucose/mannose-6-phosphate isomerase